MVCLSFDVIVVGNLQLSHSNNYVLSYFQKNRSDILKISILGLGYVGTVLTACFAKEGHQIIGVDSDQLKIDLLNDGKSPIIEKDLDSMISHGVLAGRISATNDHEFAILNTDLTMVCVGTPSKMNGDLDLKYVNRVCEHIGKTLKLKDSRHVVVVRSTILPGTTEEIIIPTLEKYSCKNAGVDFGVAINPEFLRESTAIYDFYNPPKTVIGAITDKDAYLVVSLYKGINAPLIKTTIKIAEMIKYADNVFHALKITFSNEIGNICKRLGIDSHEVINIFCQDYKLNLSAAYLKPGFAFGGSCLPKDLRALTYKAKSKDIDIPLLNTIFDSNEQHIKNALNLILNTGYKKIGILGFAFKAGTDDMRESPVVNLIETLLGKGYQIKIYDKNVSLAKLFGANKDYIKNHIPHISQLMVDSLDEIIDHAETIVIGNKSNEFIDIFPKLKETQHVIDLVRIGENIETKAFYEGICW